MSKKRKKANSLPVTVSGKEATGIPYVEQRSTSTEIKDLNQIYTDEGAKSGAAHTSTEFSAEELDQFWFRAEGHALASGSGLTDGRLVGEGVYDPDVYLDLTRVFNTLGALLPDRHLFNDNRRGSLGAKFDIADEFENNFLDVPRVNAHKATYDKIKKEKSTGLHISGLTERSLVNPLLSSDWAAGSNGYVKDGLRDLGFKIGDHGLPLLTKVKGADFATTTHNEVINYYLRQAIAKDQIIDEFLTSETAAFALDWDHDTTPQNCHRKFAKELAKAQVLYLDPMVAQMIDAQADELFRNGMETGDWPTLESDEMTEFDNNMFIVSVGLDPDSGKTWPTIHWYTRGYGTRSATKDVWINSTAEEIAELTDGMNNIVEFTDNPSSRRKSNVLIAHGFDDWGRADATTAWNFNEKMWVSDDIAQREAVRTEDMEHPDYIMAMRRNELRGIYLNNLKETNFPEDGVRNPALPFELVTKPTWAINEDNARVRCGIRVLLDYVNRRRSGFNEMPEIPIPYRRLKVTKRNAGKFGFDPNSWKPTIKIIDLPRKPYRPAENTASGRRLTCQFIVEKHWRDQYCPKDPVTGDMRPAYLDEDKLVRNPESHKRILVPVHIKGPEDRPFKEFSALVYAVMALNEEEVDV